MLLPADGCRVQHLAEAIDTFNLLIESADSVLPLAYLSVLQVTALFQLRPALSECCSCRSPMLQSIWMSCRPRETSCLQQQHCLQQQCRIICCLSTRRSKNTLLHVPCVLRPCVLLRLSVNSDP